MLHKARLATYSTQSNFAQQQELFPTRLWYIARMASVRMGLTASSTTRLVRLQGVKFVFVEAAHKGMQMVQHVKPTE